MSKKRQTITVERIVPDDLNDDDTRVAVSGYFTSKLGGHAVGVTVTSEPVPEPIEVTLRYVPHEGKTVSPRHLASDAASDLNRRTRSSEWWWNGRWEPVD